MFLRKLREKSLAPYEGVISHEKAAILYDGATATAVSGFFYSFLSYLIGFTPGMIFTAVCGIIMCFFPILFLKKVPIIEIGIVYIFIGCVSNMLNTWFSGGINSYVLPWMATVPLAALLLINKTWANVYLIISLVFTAILGYIEYLGIDLPKNYVLEYDTAFATFCYLGVILMTISLALIFEKEKQQAFQVVDDINKEMKIKNTLLEQQSNELSFQKSQIEKEKEKSDRLLLNILPAQVAEELKNNGKAIARSYEQVSVLFSDFVGFSKISKRLSPSQLVDLIDFYYRNIDKIIEKHNLEKIKTIGDSYMCVGGIRGKTKNHKKNIIAAALKIQQFLEAEKIRRSQINATFFEARIGIHIGPVIAGVVGEKKFAYDIWGDTVNLAARMEATGEPGKVNISEQTYELVKKDFKCTPRGKVTAKNIGEVEMYFVV